MKNIKKVVSALSKEAIDKIKEELLARKKQILKDLRDISGETEDKDDYTTKFPDYGDKKDENAQEIDEYTTNIATEKVLESTLRDINKALERIEGGEYGVCKYCKQAIGEKRMMARPVASACVECKTKLQNGTI
jgi:DnaK suppressor protein